MAADVYKILAAVNPDKYSGNSSEVKGMIRQGDFKGAIKIAKPKALKEYKLIYNSPFETLEPVYFWILDFMNQYSTNKTEKLIDNFSSSPGSGHFSELMGKATRMQEEAMKIYATVNTVIKSIQNLLYDLQEFKLRLKNYENANSKDKEERISGLISLKQIWMDQVDIKKGNGSLNMLAQQLGFVTIRDAFMFCNSLDDVEGADLNERVKRILKARVQEFLDWKTRSEIELKKRYEIEKTYLKTQVSTLKLYSRWAKPYLKAAEELTMDNVDNAGIVNAFNTIYLQLVIMKKDEFGQKEIDDSVNNGDLPKGFNNIKFKRKYYACTIIDFTFRGIPQRADQHYTFGGRVDVTFKAYALNQDEYDLFKYELDKSDLNDALNLVEGSTTESLEQIQEDIDFYLNDNSEEEEKKKQEELREQDVNPFSALLGLSKIFPKKKESKKSEDPDAKGKALEKKGISKDSYAESVVRALASKSASKYAYTVYDIYKKAHGMPSTKEQV